MQKKFIENVVCLKAHTIIINHKLVHASGTQGGSDSINNGLAGIDVANELRLSLARVCPLFQQDDWSLLKNIIW